MPTHVLLLVESDAEVRAGGAGIFRELVQVWGLKPYHRAKGFKFYSGDEIDDALKLRNSRKERET